MRRLLEKLRAAAPQARDQRDRRRRARLRDRHQETLASDTDEISKRDTDPLSSNIVEEHATNKTTESGNVGGNHLPPTTSPSPISNDDTIRKVSHRCLSLFLENINIAKSLNGPESNGETHSTLQDELMRFKLWGSNIGVFAEVHASLDFRLRDLPDIVELFLRQLDTIEERLKQVSQMIPSSALGSRGEDDGRGSQYECPECGRVFALPSDTRKHLETVHSIYYTRDHQTPGHGIDTEESFDNWSQPELLQSIHESIDWLHRLSNMVRKASFNHQNKRAANLMLRDENGEKSEELTRSLLEGLTHLYQFYIRTHAPGVGETLAKRLVQTMIVRHKRILHRRARGKVLRLEELDYSPPKIAKNPQHMDVPISVPKTGAPSVGKRPDLPQPTTRTMTAGSQVTATTIDAKMFHKKFAPSEVSKATSNSLIVPDRVLVPPPPKAAKSGAEFVCGYCGLLLKAREADSAVVWAKHIKKDLDPYICVFDECETPLEIYSSSREWLSHMRSQHRMRWHCFATSHEPSFFETPGALEEHVKAVHSDHFSSEEISFLVENSSHPSLSVIEQCPFCQETAENTEEHVARHLVQFALRSLPWSEDYSSSYHPSQSSRSARSEGTASSLETNGDEEGMLEVRETDWDAWETEIQAVEDNDPESIKSQWPDSDVIGLHDFISPNYDAAEDELLEPFRRRANLGSLKDQSTEPTRTLDGGGQYLVLGNDTDSESPESSSVPKIVIHTVRSDVSLSEPQIENPLWSATSLVNFNVETPGSMEDARAGYPFLSFLKGTIIDVISTSENGEVWLAVNRRGSSMGKGWVYSKHFAKI